MKQKNALEIKKKKTFILYTQTIFDLILYCLGMVWYGMVL